MIGLVTQDSILFNDSIKNNLLIAKENASDDEKSELIIYKPLFYQIICSFVSEGIGSTMNKFCLLYTSDAADE